MQFTVVSFLVLAASLLVAVSPWMMSLESFETATTPANLGALAGIVGGVLLAWLGKSPLKPKGGGG